MMQLYPESDNPGAMMRGAYTMYVARLAGLLVLLTDDHWDQREIVEEYLYHTLFATLLTEDENGVTVTTLRQGDGLMIAGGECAYFDQNNAPRYPAYELIGGQTAEYLDIQTFSSPSHLLISTDGLLSLVGVRAESGAVNVPLLLEKLGRDEYGVQDFLDACARKVEYATFEDDATLIDIQLLR
jgi:hypothetical protein